MKISPLYILPNLFTAGSIFLGVLSIMCASSGAFETACCLILCSMVLDGLDGRVARLVGKESKFGMEFDSLADVVAFGAAPAMLLFFYLDMSYSRADEAVCALFVTLGAIRLARFNITTTAEPNNFIGLPIPSAAAFVVLWILCNIRLDLDFPPLALLGLAFVASLLMVSNVRYPSFKKMQWRMKHFVLLVILLGLVLVYPIGILCALMSLYVAYGLLRWLVLRAKILFFKPRT